MVLNSQFPKFELLQSSLNQLPPWVHPLFHIPSRANPAAVCVTSLPRHMDLVRGPDRTGGQAQPGFRPEFELLTCLKMHSNAKLFLMPQSYAITPYFVASVELSISHMPYPTLIYMMCEVYFLLKEPTSRSGNVSGTVSCKIKFH